MLGVGLGESLEEELRAVPGSDIHCNSLDICVAPTLATQGSVYSIPVI